MKGDVGMSYVMKKKENFVGDKNVALFVKWNIS